MATVSLWAAVALYGVLAVRSPWPRAWWIQHMSLVNVGSEALALLPFVIALGLLLWRLFRKHAVLYTLTSVAIALLVAFADFFRQPELLAPALRITWGFFLPFLIGPPLIVFVLTRLRSNNRSRGP